MLGVRHPLSKDLDHSFFNEIDSEEKAYWLGFLMADGCVRDNNSVTLGLSAIDKGHIEKFKNSIKSNHCIYKDQHKFSISFRSKEVCESLIKLGVKPRKSFVAETPVLTEGLQRHFWRGMIDGDGCLHFQKDRKIPSLVLVGSFSSCNSFREWVHSYIITKSNVTKHGPIFRFSFAGKAASYILEVLYKDCSFYLDRKYAKYLELKGK